MAVVYATLIIKGKKTIEQVPGLIREQVKEILVDMDLPELAEYPNTQGKEVMRCRGKMKNGGERFCKD